jgi:hypothetical protein
LNGYVGQRHDALQVIDVLMQMRLAQCAWREAQAQDILAVGADLAAHQERVEPLQHAACERNHRQRQCILGQPAWASAVEDFAGDAPARELHFARSDLVGPGDQRHRCGLDDIAVLDAAIAGDGRGIGGDRVG